MTDKKLIIGNLHQQALDALEAMQSYADAEPERAEKAEAELAALRERLASWDALERMADNARELGLDYDEPVKEKNT